MKWPEMNASLHTLKVRVGGLISDVLLTKLNSSKSFRTQKRPRPYRECVQLSQVSATAPWSGVCVCVSLCVCVCVCVCVAAKGFRVRGLGVSPQAFPWLFPRCQ